MEKLRYHFLFLLLFLTSAAYAQSTRKIVKDFDGDLKKDSVRIDDDKKVLVLWLSTKQYKKVESKPINYLNFGNTLVATKTGFEFWNNYDRSGFISVFKYNKTAKKMQLVQMRRTDDKLGRENPNEGLFESSINLLTNKYLGVIKREVKGKTVKTFINADITYPKTYLETFGDAINFDYQEKCIANYEKFNAKK
ncbi:hypothetical protein [Pedobacter namyangjuensis]|uniref:hypothetical protein n=1 Tax=Pedobacter namyangjuensis TaxID=600626 RepID=UPI000DE23DC1|nr:hypothetical protein [Pedobacter namyangjuensis]